jgi:hypothetical protein
MFGEFNQMKLVLTSSDSRSNSFANASNRLSSLIKIAFSSVN